jgi:electron transfer flavoprotein beta subunit
MEVQVVDGGSRLRVKRELEGGWFQYVGLPLPALLTIQSGINQLRYATLKGIMAAKKKEVRKVTPAEASPSRQRIVGLYAPQKAKQTVMITGSPAEAAKALVARLRDEARVL